MKIHSRTELARLLIAGLFHTARLPNGLWDRTFIAWSIIYYAVFWRAEDFVQGVVLGCTISYVAVILTDWIYRANRWVLAHGYALLHLTVYNKDESIKKAFYLTVPPNFPKDWDTQMRIFKGML